MGTANRGFSYREQVGPAAVGLTALDHLAARYLQAPRETWAARFAAGEIELEARLAEGTELLRAGQWLVWHRPPWVEPEVPRSFAVLYEDSWLLAVDKPSGLPSIPGGGFLENTLLALVRERDPDWSPMHRLGRGTSGLLLFARTAAGRAGVQRALRDGSVCKRYLALASGLPSAPQLLRFPIGPVPHERLGFVHAASETGKRSETQLETSEPRPGGARVGLRLITGRPHQIRIHLAAAGHPLVGDPLYGIGGKPLPSLPGLPGDLGYHLHAWRLELPHPADQRALVFEAPVPEALR